MAARVNDRELLRSLSKKMTLADVEAMLSKVKQTRSDIEESDDETSDTRFQSSRLAGLYSRIPALKGFLSMPALPSSVVPASLDCGMTRARHIVYLIFNEPDTKCGVIAFLVVMLAIALSIGSFCVSTLTEYRVRAALGIEGSPEQVFAIIEKVCIGIFTAEYGGRLLTVTAAPTEQELDYIEHRGWVSHGAKPCPLAWPTTLPHAVHMVKTSVWKLLKFILTPLNLIDAIAIAPFYYNLVFTSDVSGNLMIIRVLRLARVFRLARMSKRMEGVQILASTMYTALDALGFLAFFLCLAVIMFGTIIFFCEGGDYDAVSGQFLRPNVLGTAMEPSPFKSIPHSFWWTIVTMTTVGYGDMVPTTDAGRTLGSIILVCGVMVLALPITVVGSAFTEEYAKYKERRLVELIEERERAEQELASQEAEHAAEKAAADKQRHAQAAERADRPPSSGTDDPASVHRTAEDAGRLSAFSNVTPSAKSAQAAGSHAQEHAVVTVQSPNPPSSPQPGAHGVPKNVSVLGRLREVTLGKSFTSRSKRVSVSSVSSPPLRAATEESASRTSPGPGHKAVSRDSLPSSSQRELDLLVAMRRGRARLQAVSALETAFKTGHVPLTAEAVYNGRLGAAGLGGITSPLAVAADNSAALAEVADVLSQQMREQHKDASEASAAYKGEVSALKAVVQAQAQSMERMRDEMCELKQAMGAVLQALQAHSALQLPGSTNAM